MRRRTKPASALLTATIIAAALATSATILITQTRTARAWTGQDFRLERASLQSASLYARALVLLDSGAAGGADGVLLEDGRGARVHRQDAAGLVDINAAEPALLSRLFIGLGIDPQRADALAARIADWRDADHDVRVGGAERADYAAAGLPAPANRPFQVETELGDVIGFEPALLACIAPLLTVYSGMAAPDPQAMPTALGALSVTPQSAPSSPAPLALGRVTLLTIDAPFSQSAALRRRYWVRLTGNLARPLVIHRAEEALAARTAPPLDFSCALARSRAAP